MRLNKDTYLMSIAEAVAQRSTCDRASVGCVIADSHGHILCTGYNGSLSGTPHCDDVGHMTLAGRCIRTVHAEANAVAHAARRGTPLLASVAYVTVHPCVDCAKLLASAGVTKIVFRDPYREDTDATVDELMAEAGVRVEAQ